MPKSPTTKRYKLTHRDLVWEMEVEIDHAIADPAIKAMLEFYAGWQSRLSLCDGDYTAAFLKFLGQLALCEQVGYGWSTTGLISHLKDIEGLCPLDGTPGIKILSADDNPIEECDIDVDFAQ